MTEGAVALLLTLNNCGNIFLLRPQKPPVLEASIVMVRSGSLCIMFLNAKLTLSTHHGSSTLDYLIIVPLICL